MVASATLILLVDAPLVSISKSYVALFFVAFTSFSKNLTSDLYDQVTEIQISLKLLQIPLWYQFQTPVTLFLNSCKPTSARCPLAPRGDDVVF